MLPTRDVAPRAIGEFLKRQPVSAGKVRFAWDSSVGVSVARATSVTLDRSGTLLVTAETESWRSELLRSAPLITRRMADLLGRDTVKRLNVTRRQKP